MTATNSRMKRLRLLLAFASLFIASPLLAQSAAIKQPSEQLAPVGFHIYHVKSSGGSTIRCYLSDSSKKLPLIVNIDGSGSSSAFTKSGKRINGGITQYLASLTSGVAHVMVVEKPGVELFDSRQTGNDKASKAFLENYTLEYITKSHVEAIRAVLRLRQVSDEKVLIFGISDGGQFAAEVSAHLPEATHVAPLACGGPTQIFDFVTFAARPRENDKPGDAQRRIEEVYSKWQAIAEDPTSIDKFWYGHPYRRWASLCSSSTIEALLKTNAKIFVAHGTLDEAVPIESFDALVATLHTKGKSFVAKRMEGMDHHFQSKLERKQNRYDSFDQLVAEILKWWQTTD